MSQDAFAILLAAHHPSLRLLGITTIHGNSSLENTTTNALRVLEAIGRPDVPVYAGSRKPFCRPAVHAPDIHGDSGLDGTDLLPKATRGPVTDANPIVAMRDALMAQPKGTAWVIATGALTNVGLLFATFPEVAAHIHGLSIMGGAIGGGFTDAPMSRLPGEHARIGNVTPWAEFNIYVRISVSPAISRSFSNIVFGQKCDPEASKSIFSNPILAPKTTMIALDLTHQVLASRSVQNRILHGSTDPTQTPSVLRKMMHALLVFFAQTYDTVFGLSSGPPLHDPLAVAVAISNLNPSFAKKHPDQALKFNDKNGERFAVDVVTDGIHSTNVLETGQLGRTLATPMGGHGVAIPRGVDLEAFWGLILDCLERADECNAARKS
ncbi:hypothetical protein CDV55_102889 [Aspergillus turcosus]|uniref:Inosine/uridine-preferring nucleoside hydrolase domain-containing protein n=1 Tax=Aspergillus turcosus TaxID=1245748 RepID=A0A229XC49_9EURO|nr:hypothetical protein CDV55_102889 [Aspergillus turcosus]RLL96637.1 hypothetical protein CFD26_104853 [Aspergillus turcosus]